MKDTDSPVKPEKLKIQVLQQTRNTKYRFSSRNRNTRYRFFSRVRNTRNRFSSRYRNTRYRFSSRARNMKEFCKFSSRPKRIIDTGSLVEPETGSKEI